jgi:two-component system chemotaxis response regulator CheY
MSAVTFLKANPIPDLLILDLNLQDNRVLQFLQQVRKQTDLANLPVLVLTDFPDPTQIREALQAGANRYLTKMFVGSNLLHTIREMLPSK